MAFGHTIQAIVIATLALTGLATAADSVGGERLDLELLPVDLSVEKPDLVRAGELTYLAGYELRSSDPRFGGLSGLLISPDGKRILAVSDTALWISADLIRDHLGVLSDLADARIGQVSLEDGKPVDKRSVKVNGDAEAIERDFDGGLLVSFERRHRILKFAPSVDVPVGKPVQLPPPPGLRNVPSNSGFEAIATLHDGRLLTMTENHQDQNGDRIGWIFAEDRKSTAPLKLRTAGLFRPTDFSVLPDGDLLLLERSYTPLAGPGMRISHLAGNSVAPGVRLEPTTLAEVSLPLTVDNFEGLAAIAAPGGGWHLFVLSDDNFNPLQRTLLFQFHWAGQTN